MLSLLWDAGYWFSGPQQGKRECWWTSYTRLILLEFNMTSSGPAVRPALYQLKPT